MQSTAKGPGDNGFTSCIISAKSRLVRKKEINYLVFGTRPRKGRRRYPSEAVKLKVGGGRRWGV